MPKKGPRTSPRFPPCSTPTSRPPTTKPEAPTRFVVGGDLLAWHEQACQPVPPRRHPATGLVQRLNVYSLDNSYWDCYREDERQAA